METSPDSQLYFERLATPRLVPTLQVLLPRFSATAYSWLLHSLQPNHKYDTIIIPSSVTALITEKDSIHSIIISTHLQILNVPEKEELDDSNYISQLATMNL